MRDDFLASVCIVDEGDVPGNVERIRALAQALAGAFRYYEVLFVVSENDRAAIAALAPDLADLGNLRIMLAANGTRLYQRRLMAASEAIGDVVAIVDPDGIADQDLFTQLAACHDENAILRGWHRASRWIEPGHKLLSIASRHQITSRASRTIVLSREWLNRILARGSAALDLRFEPKTPLITCRKFPMASPRGRAGSLGQRYELLTEILIAGAPRYLKFSAASAFVVAMLALVFAAYAVLVFSFARHVAPGWFSTSLVQAGSVFFIATGMSVLAMAIVAVLEKLGGGEDNIITGEISNIDFFDATRERNVAMEGEAAAAQAGSGGAR